MELKRKIYDKLIEWKKNDNGKTALLIEGARRIGKSTIARKFGEEKYKSYILIDFSIANTRIKNNFENLTNLDIFFQNISLEYNTQLFKRESLIIFDEVQSFPIARQAIKHLVADGRYDYIETGSLISIKENVENILIPSEEKQIRMYPLDFEEFLWAANENVLHNYIKECASKRIKLDDNFHKKAMRLFKEYIIVGGMPESVKVYFENNRDFIKSDEEKRNILSLYRSDIKKAKQRYNLKVSSLFESIPGFLSKHEKKIVLSSLGNNQTFDKFDEALFWLEDSMICNLCYKCTDPNVGFSLNKDENAIKCYMGDTGLLFSQVFSENNIQSSNLFSLVISDRLPINKGMLYENVISQLLVASGHKLYFYSLYSKEKHRNDIEIDFLVSSSENSKIKVNPIEVKSSKNYTSISLEKFKTKFRERIGESFIIHPKPLFIDKDIIKIPPYMFFCFFQ